MRVDVGSARSVDIVRRRFHMFRTTLRQSMSAHLDLCVHCARNNAQQEMHWWSTNPDFINKNNSNLFPDLDLRIQQLMSRGQDGVWQCHHCEYTTKARQGMVNHIESRHVESNGVACQFCPRVCPTRHAMQMHVLRQHQAQQQVWYVFLHYDSVSCLFLNKLVYFRCFWGAWCLD